MRIILASIIALGLLVASGCSSSEQKEQPKPAATPAATKAPTTQPVAQPEKEAAKLEKAPATQPKPLARESTAPKEAPSPVKPTAPAAVPVPVAAAPAASQPAPAPGSSNRVVIETSSGNIVIELAADQTPITVGNFLRYVDEKFYDGTMFHRVIHGFMIQGGGYTAEFQEKPTHDPITNEANKGLKNVRGTIAMARKGDPNSATSQFFINTVDNAQLDFPNMGGGYCAFGRVVEGMDVVDAISEIKTVSRGGPFTNLPMPPVVIKSAHRQ